MIIDNWASPIHTLSENGIIDRIIEYGFLQNDITTLRDLQSKRESLPQFLKEQALYLSMFLEPIISVNSHSCSIEEFFENLPKNLISATNFIFNSANQNERILLNKRYASVNDFIFALFSETEQVLDDFGMLESPEDRYAYIVASKNVIDKLCIYLECTRDCVFFGRYLRLLKVYHSLELEKRNYERTRNKAQVISNVQAQRLETLFTELTDKLLSTRSKNVLSNNGINNYKDFQSWIAKNSSQGFSVLHNCGRKSTMELDALKSEMSQLETSIQTTLEIKEQQNNANTPTSNETHFNEKDLFAFIEKNIDNWPDEKLKHWTLDLFGSSKEFAIKFMSSAINVYEHIICSLEDKAFMICTSLMELLVNTIYSCPAPDAAKMIEERLFDFARCFNKDYLKLLEGMLLNKQKKELLKTEFNTMTSKLSVRSRHALQNIINPEDNYSIVKFAINQFDFMSIHNVGRKTSLELSAFYERFHQFLLQIAFSNENTAKYELIAKRFPFLNDEETKFVASFEVENKHLPVFYIAERLLKNDRHKQVQIYRDYYGIGRRKKIDIIEISTKYNISRERTRQIISDSNKWIATTTFFKKENWGYYPFIENKIITKYDSFFRNLCDLEHLNISFLAFLGILNLISPKIIQVIKVDNTNIVIAYDKTAVNFKFSSAVKEMERLSRIKKDTDIRISVSDFFVNNNEYYQSNTAITDNNQKVIISDALLNIAKELELGIVKEEGQILFKANKINYTEVIYNIIRSHGKPMRIGEICTVISTKYPFDKHNSPKTIRPFIQKDNRIESIGRTSTYKLKSWKDYSGSIPQLLVDILTTHPEPITSAKLSAEALLYRPNSTRKSINSNIYYKICDGTLISFYPDLVGLNGKDYGKRYQPVPKTFEEYLNAFIDFVESEKHFPLMQNKGYEGMLNRWYNKTKELVSLKDKEIISFSEAMEKLQAKHYPRNAIEYNFWKKCERYKKFVAQAHRMILEEDEKEMYRWFLKSSKNLPLWKDNRKLYFVNLIQFIKNTLT